MDVDQHAKRMSEEVPRYFYKYKSLAGDARLHTRDLIVNQRLYFPGPAQLNDPFETKPYFETTATLQQQRKHIAGMVNRHEREVPRAERRRRIALIGADRANFRERMIWSTQETLKAVGIFSFSARHLDLLMWPHYADNHRGVCVRFEAEALFQAEQVPFPVIYADQRPVCDPILEPTVDWLNKSVLTKGTPWSYEKEWRLVKTRGAGQTTQLTTPTINGVLLGANISPADREEVLQWAATAGRTIKVAQTSFHPSAYSLNIEQVA